MRYFINFQILKHTCRPSPSSWCHMLFPLRFSVTRSPFCCLKKSEKNSESWNIMNQVSKIILNIGFKTEIQLRKCLLSLCLIMREFRYLFILIIARCVVLHLWIQPEVLKFHKENSLSDNSCVVLKSQQSISSSA